MRVGAGSSAAFRHSLIRYVQRIVQPMCCCAVRSGGSCDNTPSVTMSPLRATLRFAWSRRGLTIWVAALGIIVTVAATIAVLQRDQALERNRFGLLASERINAIHIELKQPTKVLPLLAESKEHFQKPDQAELERLGHPLLKEFPNVAGLAYVPVENTKPGLWPAMLGESSHPAYSIITREDRRLLSQSELWLKRLVKRHSSLGDNRRPFLLIDSIDIEDEDVEPNSIIVGYAVGDEKDKGTAQGWYLLELDVEASINRALGRLAETPIDCSLTQLAHGNREASASEKAKGNYRLETDFTLFNHSYRAVAVAPVGSLANRYAFAAWVSLFGGLFTTVALTAYVASIVGRAARIEQVVEERTSELRESNKMLNQEITVRKHVESRLSEYAAQLELSNRELEHAREEMGFTLIELKERNQELDEFNYIASHDLQEPVRKMISFSTLLKQDLGKDLSETAQQDLHYIIDAAYRMKDLISDLLAFSRVGREAMKAEEVELSECVQTAIDSLMLSIEENSADVRCAELPTAKVDRTLVTQLFQNLIGNAIKFCDRAKPTVEIDAVEKNGMCVVSVRDNGIGIREKYRDRIFQPFQRLHGKTKYPGNGIGLAICRKTVARHGGKIWVESEADQGSTFFFSLPMSVEESPSENESLKSDDAGVGKECAS